MHLNNHENVLSQNLEMSTCSNVTTTFEVKQCILTKQICFFNRNRKTQIKTSNQDSGDRFVVNIWVDSNTKSFRMHYKIDMKPEIVR